MAYSQIDKTAAELESSTHQQYDGDQAVNVGYDDFKFQVGNLRINPATSKPDFDYTNFVYLMDGSSTETLAARDVTSHRFKVGSGVLWYPHVHWLQEASGVVVWQLEYEFREPDYGQLTTGTITTTGQEFTYTSGSLHQISEFDPIDMSAFSSSAIMTYIRISRLGGDASDTYSGDAKFYQFDFHVPLDQERGSRQVFIK